VTTLITSLKSATDLYGRVRDVRRREERNSDDIERLKERERHGHERHEREDHKRRGSRGEHHDEDVEGHIHDSRMLIRKEYDYGYDRLGQKFAIGDGKWMITVYRP
jgi:hypothetical protein